MKKLIILFSMFVFTFYTVSFSVSEEEISTNSKNIIVLDRKTLSVLYEKNAYEKVPMASTTKIMTCILVLENGNLNDIVTVSKNSAKVSGSTLGLKENMKISVNDLLYGLMLRSGNDCAIALAEYISGNVENFSNVMNKKSSELNLQNTHFVTPHGLDDPNHYTTAYDLAILTNYALQNETFKKIVSTKTYSINFNGNSRVISNTNELLGNLDGVYGVKTGFTFNAGRCLVSACKRDNLDIIVVVLGADTKKIRTHDSSNLINYIFNEYDYINLYSTINESFNKYLDYFNKNYKLEKTQSLPILKLAKLKDYEFPLSKENKLQLSSKIYLYTYKFNPNITQFSKIGDFYLFSENKIICKIDIILSNKLEKNSCIYYFKNIFYNISHYF